MTPDIIRKLQAELNAGVTNEVQVVYVLAGIRKLIELERSADQYQDLVFHIDWALHPKMDRLQPEKSSSNSTPRMFILKRGCTSATCRRLYEMKSTASHR